MASVNALLKRWKESREPSIADEIEAAEPARWARRFSTARRAPIRRALGLLSRLPNDDPRITSFLIECLHKARWAGPTARPIWAHIFQKLVALNDVRALPALLEASTNSPLILGAAHASWVKETLLATAARLEQKNFGKTASTSLGTTRRSGRTALELVKPVFENPTDDESRLVVADALLEIGDSWGELISMQFDPSRKRSEADALVRKNIDRIAGPIAAIGVKRYFVVAKGFLTTCNIGNSAARPKWEAALGSPHWATVREVDVGYGTPGWWLSEFARQHLAKSLECMELFGSLCLRRDPRSGALWVTRASQTAPVPARSAPPTPRALTFLRQLAEGLSPKAREQLIRTALNESVRSALQG